MFILFTLFSYAGYFFHWFCTIITTYKLRYNTPAKKVGNGLGILSVQPWRFTSLLWRNIMIYYFRKSLDMSWFWPKVICASTYTRSLEEKAHMCPFNTFLRKKYHKFLLLTKNTNDLRMCYDLYTSSLVHS